MFFLAGFSVLHLHFLTLGLALRYLSEISFWKTKGQNAFGFALMKGYKTFNFQTSYLSGYKGEVWSTPDQLTLASVNGSNVFRRKSIFEKVYRDFNRAD
jgi:hypothetical protein